MLLNPASNTETTASFGVASRPFSPALFICESVNWAEL